MGIIEQKEEAIPDVDDTDGLDPEAEFEAWRMRELSRIKKEKEEEIRVEQEREEIERRRALPEEQRLKEDLEKAQKSREEKPKGQQRFLQKYWHKGAFRQVSRCSIRHFTPLIASLRIKKSSNDTIIPKLPSPMLTSPRFPKLCRSKILANAAARSTRIFWIRILPSVQLLFGMEHRLRLGDVSHVVVHT